MTLDELLLKCKPICKLDSDDNEFDELFDDWFYSQLGM